MIYNDNQTIHVSQNNGDDSNIDFGYSNARKTINAAIVDLTADVTTIIIWPGTYDEGAIEIPEGINVIGTNRELCIIANTQLIDRNSGERMFSIKNGCQIKNLSFESAFYDFNYACIDLESGTPGVDLEYAEKVVIENCDICGYNIGLNGSEGKNILIQECYLQSGRIALSLTGYFGCIVNNCYIRCGCYYNGSEYGDVFIGARISSETTFNNCIFRTYTPSNYLLCSNPSWATTAFGNPSAPDDTPMGCLETGLTDTGYETHITLNNCIMNTIVDSEDYHDGNIFGISGKRNGDKQYKISLNNCTVSVIDNADNLSSEVIAIKSDDTGLISLNNCIASASDYNAQALNSSKIVLSNGEYGDSSNWSGNVVYGLDANGLDSISITEPASRASNFREMIIQTWMRFFNKITKSNDTIITYDENDIENTTQSYTSTEDLETVEKAS